MTTTQDAETRPPTATRRRPAIGTVTIGPGGWISLKRTTRPALFAAAPRPWWARMLRAHRLVTER